MTLEKELRMKKKQRVMLQWEWRMNKAKNVSVAIVENENEDSSLRRDHKELMTSMKNGSKKNFHGGTYTPGLPTFDV